ncbi:TPX2 domain-containing protein [Psidium guajava]|nr:TPX2 domain-containing protein [Psidium guajava]
MAQTDLAKQSYLRPSSLRLRHRIATLSRLPPPLVTTMSRRCTGCLLARRRTIWFPGPSPLLLPGQICCNVLPANLCGKPTLSLDRPLATIAGHQVLCSVNRPVDSVGCSEATRQIIGRTRLESLEAFALDCSRPFNSAVHRPSPFTPVGPRKSELQSGCTETGPIRGLGTLLGRGGWTLLWLRSPGQHSVLFIPVPPRSFFFSFTSPLFVFACLARGDGGVEMSGDGLVMKQQRRSN